MMGGVERATGLFGQLIYWRKTQAQRHGRAVLCMIYVASNGHCFSPNLCVVWLAVVTRGGRKMILFCEFSNFEP